MRHLATNMRTFTQHNTLPRTLITPTKTSVTTTGIPVKKQRFLWHVKKQSYFWHAYMPYLTEFSPSDSQFPTEFSNLTEFLDEFVRVL